MKKVLLFLIFNLIISFSYAQIDSSKQTLNNKSISYAEGSFFHSGQYSIGGQPVTRNELYAALMNSPASANEFKEFKKNRDRTLYIGLTAIFFDVASFFVNKPIGSSTYNNNISKVFIGTGLGLLIPEVIFAIKRNKHYKHSILLYNQQYR